MEVYFIRHGETGGNLAHRHQHEESRLTPKGVQQALSAAQAVATLQPTHLFVSDRIRALETAQAVGAATNLIPETNHYFDELCRPYDMYGAYHLSRRSLSYLYAWFTDRAGEDDCGETGESYQAFRARLVAARQLLEQLSDDSRVVIVSHSVFITLFVAHLKRPGRLSWLGAVRNFLRLKRLPNGSVTHLAYTSNLGWRVLSFGKVVSQKQE
jgi:broad specificity phosphatase PhoE